MTILFPRAAVGSTRFGIAASIAAAIFFATGCGTNGSATAATSSVEGQLAVDSFSSTPSAVQATDESGAQTSSSVDRDGSFHLDLPKDHDYSLSVTTPDGSEPLVFPRVDGSIDQSFHVSSSGETVALGTVRHFAGAPSDGFAVSDDEAPADHGGVVTDAGARPPKGDCVDGKAADGKACVRDRHPKCAGEPRGHRHGPPDGDAGLPPPPPPRPRVGDARVPGDRAVDPSQPMAVPATNPPSDVLMCGCAAHDMDSDAGAPGRPGRESEGSR